MKNGSEENCFYSLSRKSNVSNRNSMIVSKEPSYKSVARRNCPLLHYIWECNWPAAVKRSETHPLETFCVTENSGRTALHLASFNQGSPVYVAECLLEKNRHALLAKDRNWRTPLHYACTFNRGGSKHLVPLYCNHLRIMEGKYENALSLLNASEEGVPSPLRLACCNCNTSFDTIRVLVSTARESTMHKWIAPKTGGEPYWLRSGIAERESPLQAILDRAKVQELFNLDAESILQVLPEIFPSYDATINVSAKDYSYHEMVALDTIRKIVFLMDAHGKDYTGSLLHRICTTHGQKPWLVELFGALMPEQAVIPDSEGCLPLHHLILQPYSSSTKALVGAVLQINKQAGMHKIPKYDSYPFMVAIRLGWTWEGGLEELVKANPELLDVQADHGLCPTALAASMETDLTTIFELLRKAPHLCAT